MNQGFSDIHFIDHHEKHHEIYELFQKSYQVEADLVGVTSFPPLLWTPGVIQKKAGEFFGVYLDQKLVACIHLRKESDDELLIGSLVVDPACFRKGLASQLIQFSMDKFPESLFYVETAAVNIPAISLYEKFGFRLIKTYMAELNVEKVRFQLDRSK
jgi:ribosomal protein S18 acetylase RimI-like enzyme